MKTKLKMSFLTAGTALILLTGCVSSRKYKASQADVAKLQSDSAQLQQQVTSLNSNVQDLQNKNTGLQGQLDKSNSSYAEQQKNLDYYQNYFKQQQGMMSQVSDDVKNALTQAGISNADVEQTNNTVYVRLDEDELFKKNSTMVSPNGKKALDGLSQVITNKSNVNVFVAAGDSAMANSGMAMNNEPAPEPKHIVHHQVHHHYNSEGSSMVYNGPGHHNRAWALKQGRMVAVADHFLKGGVPKINVSLQQPPADGTQPSNTIKVVFVPKMEDFNPQMNGSSAVR